MIHQNDKPIIGINSTHEHNAHRWFKIPVNYVNAVLQAGGIPLILPCIPDKDLIKDYLDRLDGILFTGGDDYPPHLYGEEPEAESEFMDSQRAETDMLLMETALNEYQIPLLGICAGHQLLAIANGGKLIQNVKNTSVHGHHEETTHPVIIKDGKWLKSIFNATSLVVNSYHHQAVSEFSFPSGYEVSAMSEDGLIEAMEFRGARFVLGVQWHPERIKDLLHKNRLFGFYIQKCREYQKENERKVV